jgi:hypothetical protein
MSQYMVLNSCGLQMLQLTNPMYIYQVLIQRLQLLEANEDFNSKAVHLGQPDAGHYLPADALTCASISNMRGVDVSAMVSSQQAQRLPPPTPCNPATAPLLPEAVGLLAPAAGVE